MARSARPMTPGAAANAKKNALSPPLLIAALLTALAGGVDAIGYLLLGKLFVSFMSGNSTMLGVALQRRDWTEGLQAGGLIVLFVVGAAAGAVIARSAQQRRLPAVLLAVASLLAIAAGWPGVGLPAGAVAATVLAMGALNAALDRAGGVSVGLTYVTGALAHFGHGLGDALAGHSDGSGWRAQVVPWIGLVAGSVAGAAAQVAFGRDALWAAAGVAFALACCTGTIPRLRGVQTRLE